MSVQTNRKKRKSGENEVEGEKTNRSPVSQVTSIDFCVISKRDRTIVMSDDPQHDVLDGGQ